MKNKPIITSIFLFLVFTIMSCTEDSDNMNAGETGDSSQFTFHAGELASLSDLYIMVTDPISGDLLYWDSSTDFQDNITFDSKGAKTVDITYANEYNTGFNIITYRDVKTDFKLSGFYYSCYDGEFNFDPLNGASVDLIIPGTKEIVEIVNPAYNHDVISVSGNNIVDQENKIIYDLDNDITVIRARLRSTTFDLQFVFRFEDEQEYKSIILNKDDWVMVDDDNYKYEMDTTDLAPCSKHIINLDKNNTWIVNSQVLSSTGERIAIMNWSTYYQNQTGSDINIFVQDDIEIEELLLNVKRNNINDGYEFQNRFNTVPTSITLKDFDIEYEDITTTTFDYVTTDDYDLIRTSFKYRNDNQISSWDIYQSSRSTFDYSLPVIESEYLQSTNLIKSLLQSPHKMTTQFYTLDVSVDAVYDDTGINRQLQCLDFNSSYESIEF